MAKALQQMASAEASQGAAVVRYTPLASGCQVGFSATENIRQIIYRSPGILSNLAIKVLTNDRAASTLRSRVNTANGNMVVAITASTTGEFEDLVNTDTIASGDLLSSQLTTGAGGTTFTANVIQTIYSSTSGTTNRIVDFNASMLSSATTFVALAGVNTSSASEAFTQYRASFPSTFKNLALSITANTRDGACTFVFRKNSVNGNLTLTVPASTTGLFEDIVNTDAVVANDLINHAGTRGGAAGTATTGYCAVACESATRKFYILSSVSGAAAAYAAATTVYSAISGEIFQNATENNVSANANLKFTASLLAVNVTANTITAGSTVNLRKNAANANQTVTIPASSTGIFQDTTNIDKIDLNDSLAYQINGGATGTSVTIREFQMAAGSGGAVKDVIGINMIPWARP